MFTIISLINPDFLDIFERCKVAISNFGGKAIIEIAILSVMLLLGINLLKSRRAGALVTGMLVIVAMLFLSYLFELWVLYKFFGAIVGSGIIVVIVIFQPEIRDALEKIGNGSLKGIMGLSERKKRKEQYINAIDNICSAVTELSKDYTGALIVIERSISLSDIVRMGIVIDADVNDLLLRNLFYNKAPLHDGAVVISGEKIVAAACFLPLTERKDIDSSLGTRHRAAIGMAEKSDAIVIVVSEETGNISIAHDFSLTRDVTPVELKGFLHEHLLKKSLDDASAD